MAYEVPGFTSTVSDATPTAGQCITMSVTGGAANAGKVFTLTVHAATAAGDDTSTGSLSHTGSNVLAIGLGGVLLVLLGAGTVVVARRRREPAMHH